MTHVRPPPPLLFFMAWNVKRNLKEQAGLLIQAYYGCWNRVFFCELEVYNILSLDKT